MYSSTLSLILALNGGGWSMPRQGRFNPGKESRYPLQSRLGGPQCRCGKFRSHRDSIPGPSIAQGVAIPTELFRPQLKTKNSVKLKENYLCLVSITQSLINTRIRLLSEVQEHKVRSGRKSAYKAFGQYSSTSSGYILQILPFVQLGIASSVTKCQLHHGFPQLSTFRNIFLPPYKLPPPTAVDLPHNQLSHYRSSTIRQ